MANHDYISKWLIFIGGYMQDRGQATTGMCGFAKSAYDRYAQHGVYISYETWKQDWNAAAECIFRWSGYDAQKPNGVVEPPTIMVAAYSWGAGWGLTQLAQHLAYRGLHINIAVASDAVRHVGWTWSHSRIWGGIGISQALAYWPYHSIVKPSSIDELYWFRQGRKRSKLADICNKTTLLMGHPWVIEDPTTGKRTLAPNGVDVPDLNHSNMDDSYLFRSKVYELANNLFIKKVA